MARRRQSVVARRRRALLAATIRWELLTAIVTFMAAHSQRHAPQDRPPEHLVRSLVDGPSRVAWLQWHDEVGSTNTVAAEAAAAGAAEIGIVGADVQRSGRGRMGRGWQAPPGTALQVSFLLRPRVDVGSWTLLPLLAGVALAEVASAHVPGAQVALKWPNDLLVDERKAAGILAERVDDGVVVGIGVNTDWRAIQRPAELAGATSLSEVAGRGVDRWKVLAGLVGVLDRRYGEWESAPHDFLDSYRSWCATLGQRVRVTVFDGVERHGIATAITQDGALTVDSGDGTVQVRAGDVAHVRPE